MVTNKKAPKSENYDDNDHKGPIGSVRNTEMNAQRKKLMKTGAASKRRQINELKMTNAGSKERAAKRTTRARKPKATDTKTTKSARIKQGRATTKNTMSNKPTAKLQGTSKATNMKDITKGRDRSAKKAEQSASAHQKKAPLRAGSRAAESRKNMGANAVKSETRTRKKAARRPPRK
jgi:hypothetical protein